MPPRQLLADGSADRAAAYLRAPLAAAPHARGLEVLMVRALLGAREWAEAAALCECMRARLGDGDVDVRFLAGGAQFGVGELDKAARLWEGALRLDPDHAGAKERLKLARRMSAAKAAANELFAAGELRAAVERYSTAMAAPPPPLPLVLSGHAASLTPY